VDVLLPLNRVTDPLSAYPDSLTFPSWAYHTLDPPMFSNYFLFCAFPQPFSFPFELVRNSKGGQLVVPSTPPPPNLNPEDRTGIYRSKNSPPSPMRPSLFPYCLRLVQTAPSSFPPPPYCIYHPPTPLAFMTNSLIPPFTPPTHPPPPTHPMAPLDSMFPSHCSQGAALLAGQTPPPGASPP